MRAVVEAAGIRDVLAKSLGSSNHANVVKATIDALQQLRLRERNLRNPRHRRSKSRRTLSRRSNQS